MKTAICSNVDGPSDYHIVVVWSLSHAQVFVNPCSPPRSSVPGISQARIPEQIAISFSKGSSQPRDQIRVSCLADGFFYDWDDYHIKWSNSDRERQIYDITYM